MAMGTGYFWSGAIRLPAAAKLLKARTTNDHGYPAGTGYGPGHLRQISGMFIIVGGVPETDIHGRLMAGRWIARAVARVRRGLLRR